MANKRDKTKGQGAAGGEVRGSRSRSEAQSTGRWLWEWAKSISVAILLFLIIRTFAVEAFKIPTGSMESTLLVGDFLLVNKAVYGAQFPFTDARLPGFEEPERGDVVVFEYPLDRSKNYVKRVVGLPGDRVAMRRGALYVNGERQDESYVQHVQPDGDYWDPSFEWQKQHLAPDVDRSTYRPTRDDWGPIIVPHGSVFRDGRQSGQLAGFAILGFR